MIDPDGEEWVPVVEAATRLGIPRGRVDMWVYRDLVRSERVGRYRWVNYQDAAEREHAWRTRARGSDT